MALITRQIGSLTEVSTNRGGYYITQSFPTNFHTFFTAKILGKGEKAEDFKEVSEAEKTALENKDAQWVKPSQDLIDRWNSAFTMMDNKYGCYNETTGYFEGNSVTDITNSEAVEILDVGRVEATADGNYLAGGNKPNRCRTLPPLASGFAPTLRNAFRNCWGLKSIHITSFGAWAKESPTTEVEVKETTNFCMWCGETLERVTPIITISSELSTTHFYNGTFRVMKHIKVKGITKGLTCFSSNKALALECWQYMIANAANTSAITIKVHADVMARMLDETNTEWHQLLTDATAKNIQFAV